MTERGQSARSADPPPRWVRVTEHAPPDEYVFPCPNCGRVLDHSREGHWCGASP